MFYKQTFNPAADSARGRLFSSNILFPSLNQTDVVVLPTLAQRQPVLGVVPRPVPVASNEATCDNLFVNSVLGGEVDFSTSYNLLIRCREQQQQAINTSNSSPLFFAASSSAFQRCSPTSTVKRRVQDVSIEPLKLSTTTTTTSKRPRSSTIIEEPPDFDNGYESELVFSRCTSPEALAPIQTSPRKPRRPSNADGTEQAKSPRQVKHGLGGERRLTIEFLNNGILSSPVQTFGKYKLVIRDGLSGTHTMYAQRWRFEITHCKPGDGPDEICLRWTVTNLGSTNTISFLETPEQAHERQVKGNTICNSVVREALTHRARELELELEAEDINNHTRVAHLRSLVKELRPKQCTEGLLFFGLRHQIAQRKSN